MRRYFASVLALCSKLTRWLRGLPEASGWAMLVSVVVMFLAWLSGYHEPFIPVRPAELPAGWKDLPVGALAVLYLLAYLKLWVMLMGVVYHLTLFRAFPDIERMIRPTWWFCGLLSLWLAVEMGYEQWETQRMSMTGEVFSIAAFAVHLLLMGGLVVLPPLLMTYWSRCKILERYLLRSFLQPLWFCMVAFFTLWIVMDLLDNMQDFQSNHIGTGQILFYYVKLLPFIYVTVAPITLLLATLYTLGRMSRTNELISMLGTGKSMLQMLRPVYLVGLIMAFLSMAANFRLAPVSAGDVEQLLEDGKSSEVLIRGLMYRNQEDRRTWFVGTVPRDLKDDKMRRTEIRQEDEKGNLVKAWWGNAYWWPDSRIWSLYLGVEASYKDGKMVSMQPFDYDGSGHNRKDLEGFRETPWVLMSGALTPDFLGVPELLSYIHANSGHGRDKLAPYWTHLYYRFALPWQCLVVVLFAAPLAVVFSRRGLVGGMTSAVVFFFVMLFFDNLFLNLGKSRHLPPLVAVWMPHLLLGLVGVGLFWMRSLNRDLPRLSLKGLRLPRGGVGFLKAISR